MLSKADSSWLKTCHGLILTSEATSSAFLISYSLPIKIRQQIKAETTAVRSFVSLLRIHVDLSTPSSLQEEILMLSQEEEIHLLLKVNPSTCVLDPSISCLCLSLFYQLFLSLLSSNSPSSIASSLKTIYKFKSCQQTKQFF